VSANNKYWRFSDDFDFYDISYISYISAIADITMPYFTCGCSKLTNSNCIPKHFQSFFFFGHLQASPQQFSIQIWQHHTPRNQIVTLRAQLVNRKYSVFPKSNSRYVKVRLRIDRLPAICRETAVPFPYPELARSPV